MKMLIVVGRFLIVCLILIHASRGSLTPIEKDVIAGHADLARLAKSAEIRNFMDTSVDPCNNFYQFTCGNYYRINPPNEYPYQSNIFQTLLKSMGRKLISFLGTSNTLDTAVERKAKDFYESCTKVSSLKNSYMAKLKAIISEFGQMPALEGPKWQESEFDWLKTVAEIAHKYDIRIIVGYYSDTGYFNNSQNYMHINLQDMPLESSAVYTEDIHKNDRIGSKNRKIKLLKDFLGLDGKLAEQTVHEIFEFESNLFAGYKRDDNTEGEEDGVADDDGEDENDVDVDGEDEDGDNDIPTISQVVFTIEQMQDKYFPRLDIKRLINISYGSVPTNPIYNLLDETEVDNLAIVIRETPKRIVANYIFFYLLEPFMMKADNSLNKQQALCVKRTNLHFGKVVNNMLYRKYTTKQTEEEIEQMFQTIKSAFHNVLQSDELKWMREDTRKYALKKLETVRVSINAFKQTNFTKEYGPITINNRDYVENLKSIFALNAVKTRTKLNEPPLPYYKPDSMSFSASYVLNENIITVPLSLLQPYYLWSDLYPNAYKFGALGFIIAHELIHGFDSKGRLYDHSGNIRNWWHKDSSKYFANQTECFRDQYHRFVYGGHYLPAEETQSENIADNGGIRLAYTAYLRWYEEAARSYRNLDMETLPGLNYTSKQLFFISVGHSWCSSLHPSLQLYQASTDVHVPAEFRVRGSLANFEEFSKEFKCRRGSRMNPAKKCKIY